MRRARAKEIFQPMRWKRIGTLPDEAAKLYESARRSTNRSYNSATRRDDTPSLLARLLPSTYVSGGRIARYPTLEHSTSERENVALQYARLKPYTAKHPGQETKNAVLLESVDNYVLLNNELVPSLLHLYRPVSAPSFSERRHDFRPEKLAANDFSITYIIQECRQVTSRSKKRREDTTESDWTQPREPQHDPKDCDPNMLRGSMFAGGRTCGVCHLLAAAPSLSRRKKRVCSQCLYGETANVAAMHKAAVEAASDDGKSSVSSAGSGKTHASPEGSTMNVFQFPNLESLVSKHKASKPAVPVAQGTPSRASGRVQIDLGLDPALASSSRTPDRRRARSRQSQLSQGSVVSTTSSTSATSFVTATSDNRRATLSSHIDLDDSESAVLIFQASAR
ncbi:hypothetical protein GQ600_13414 [Phytophthora cactorum]|nr:hypothetical protein GQ600_13414 [Phytophthora cactorum]